MLREVFGHLKCEFIVTSIGVAEMLKYACNAFHAVKITFANEIGRLARSVDVDGRAVMDLVCKDTRLNISPVYLKPGFAFGGSCLPKDLRALTYVGKQNDVTTPMLGNVMGSNRAHIDHALDLVTQSGKRKIGMIGLSFKPGTDDLRESPLVTVAERLIGKGYDLRIYDPEVNLSRLLGANKRYIEHSIPHIGSLMSGDCAAVIDHAEVLIVGLAGRDLDAGDRREQCRTDQIVVDLVGLPRAELDERRSTTASAGKRSGDEQTVPADTVDGYWSRMCWRWLLLASCGVVYRDDVRFDRREVVRRRRRSRTAS